MVAKGWALIGVARARAGEALERVVPLVRFLERSNGQVAAHARATWRVVHGRTIAPLVPGTQWPTPGLPMGWLWYLCPMRGCHADRHSLPPQPSPCGPCCCRVDRHPPLPVRACEHPLQHADLVVPVVVRQLPALVEAWGVEDCSPAELEAGLLRLMVDLRRCAAWDGEGDLGES